MQVSITGRHLELTPAIKDYVESKLQHLKHSFDHVVDAHVVLSVEKFRQRCEMNLQVNGINIHGKHESEDMYASIDGVVDKLNRQLKRYRAKLKKHQSEHNQRKGREIKVSHKLLDVSAAHEELAEDHQHEVLQQKSVSAKPMSVDEAVMQMELAENLNLLVFINEATDSLNMIHRDAEGQLNWIESSNTSEV